MSKLFEVEDYILEAVAKSFNRSIKLLNEDVEALEEWMKTQSHLPEVMNKKMIRNFLLLNKCSIERTKEKLDMYYTVRSHLVDIFDNNNPKSLRLKSVMDALYIVPLPKLTPEMYRAFVFKVRDKDIADELNPVDMVRQMVNVMELRIQEDLAYGDISIMDWGGISGKFLMKLTPTLIYKLVVTLYEKIYSIRLKGVYLLNAPPFFERILAILKTIMKPKLFERIYLCQNVDLVFEKFPKSMLPKDFGGEEKSLEELNEMLAKKFDEYQNRFDELDNLRVDESLRPKKLQNHEVLGFYGNFKKLDVD